MEELIDHGACTLSKGDVMGHFFKITKVGDNQHLVVMPSKDGRIGKCDYYTDETLKILFEIHYSEKTAAHCYEISMKNKLGCTVKF